MSDFYYSASENLILWGSLKEEYQQSGLWPDPDDVVLLTDEMAAEFTGDAPEGKVRVAGEDGLPAWTDAPAPTQEELVADASAEKQCRIDQANAYMNSKQWPGKAAMGRLTDSEKAQYNAWLDYLDELEAVDTAMAPDITWPTPPSA